MICGISLLATCDLWHRDWPGVICGILLLARYDLWHPDWPGVMLVKLEGLSAECTGITLDAHSYLCHVLARTLF